MDPTEGKSVPDMGAREEEISNKLVGEISKRHQKVPLVSFNSVADGGTLLTSTCSHGRVVEMDTSWGDLTPLTIIVFCQLVQYLKIPYICIY